MEEQHGRLHRLGSALLEREPGYGELWGRVADVAAEAHEEQFRNDERPYLAHALDVATILQEWGVDPLIVMGGLLHDAVRYGRMEEEAVVERLAHADLGALFRITTRISSHDSLLHYVRDNSRLQKIFDLMVEDVRAVLIRCANRLANLRDLDAFTAEQRRGLLLNSDEVYLPLLERLGMWEVRVEVENRLFQARSPERYAAISAWQQREQAARAERIEQWQARLVAALARHGLEGMQVSVLFRHPASLFRRHLADMPRDADDLDKLDARHLFVTRVLAPAPDMAYHALAAVHECGMPGMASFRDYIAGPKANGYAALHTSIIANNELYRVYLRTPRLNELASQGILLPAAYHYWRSGEQPAGWQAGERRVLDHFMGSLRSRKRDRLALLTPRGDVIELEEGATVLDFAYAIHTDLGRQTGRAFVNNVEVPLDGELHSGDIVQIRKDPGRRWPDPHWASLARTEKAREAIQGQLRQRPEIKGRNRIDRELRNRGRRLEEYESRIAAVASDIGCTLEELFTGLVKGNFKVDQIVDRLLYVTQPPRTTFYRVRLDPESVRRFPTWSAELILAAACCAPPPGSPIVGYHTERGIELHLSTCSTLIDSHRKVPLHWETERVEAQLAKFQLKAVSRRGLINDLTTLIRRANVDIVYLEGKRQAEMDEVSFTLEVTNELELGHLLNSVRRIQGINHVLINEQEAEEAVDELRGYLAPPQPIHSPFSPGHPAAGKGFWGREMELRTVETLLGGAHATSLLVQGPRRIGKTSLLKHLATSRLVREQFDYVYVDLQFAARSDTATVFRHLARQMGRALDPKGEVPLPSMAALAASAVDTFCGFLDALAERRAGTSRRILIALDEFGTLVDSLRAKELDPRIFNMLRSVIQHDASTCLLLCTSDDVVEMLAEEGVLDLLTVTPAVRLHHLDEEAAQQLIQEPLRGHLYFEPEALSALMQVTDLHPYYLQILGSTLITRLNNERRRTVYESDIIELVRRHAEQNGSEFQHLWEQQPGRESQALVLRALCAPPAATRLSPFALETVQRRLREVGHALSDEEVLAALERLAQLFTLTRAPQADGSMRYHVAVDLFRDWFAVRHPLRRGTTNPYPKS